jgi:putative transposase
MRKKIVSPGHRRQMAQEVVEAGVCSGRAVCRILHLSRATYWYRGKPPSPRQGQMIERMRLLSEKHPRYGYRRITALLRQEGWMVGKRQLQRLRRAQGLRVPPTRRKIVRRGVSTGLPTKAIHRGHVWTWDFISDATVRGGTLRMLSILDEYTRECHVLRADRALRSEDVLKWLKKAIEEHGAPQYLRSDNGSEFIAKEVQRWLAHNQIKTIYIEPASPWQNGFVESFHGRFRDECLNREQLWTLTEARVVIEDFRHRYNHFRPHSKLGYQSPVRFAQKLTPSPAPVGLRPPYAEGGQTQTHNLTIENNSSD